MFRSLLFFLCTVLPAERFLGSGQQTKETEIEADFLWQAATILWPETVQKALVWRIRDTFLFHPCFSTNSYKSSKPGKENGKSTTIPSSSLGLFAFPLAQCELAQPGSSESPAITDQSQNTTQPRKWVFSANRKQVALKKTENGVV